LNALAVDKAPGPTKNASGGSRAVAKAAWPPLLPLSIWIRTPVERAAAPPLATFVAVGGTVGSTSAATFTAVATIGRAGSRMQILSARRKHRFPLAQLLRPFIALHWPGAPGNGPTEPTVRSAHLYRQTGASDAVIQEAADNAALRELEMRFEAGERCQCRKYSHEKIGPV
jgi:hypothetical protein